jgi:hypothetical protein
MAAALAFAVPAQAVPIIDTFGPGNSFSGSSGWAVGPIDGRGNLTIGVGFTLDVPATIDDVAVAAWATGFTLTIMGDAGGLPDDILLATVSDSFSVDGYLEFTPSITLGAGSYFLVMMSPLGVTGSWQTNDQGITVPFVHKGSYSWISTGPTTTPALRIGATPVPEPATLALMGAGLLGIAVLRRREPARRAS